jgi:nucleoside-diphosphate-sugar epimerase
MEPSRRERVLVTGSAGRIGRAVVQELVARGWPVRGLDRVPTPGTGDFVVGNIVDAATVSRAMDGVHTLIHLAATPDDVDDVVNDLFPHNIVGVYRVLEAAKQAGVRRLILASSGQVVWWQRMKGPLPIGTHEPPTPRSWYAAAKLFLEGAGRSFAEAFGLNVIVARLGWCPRDRGQVQEMLQLPWAPDVYLSPGDAGRFFAAVVETAGPIHYTVVYATSRPARELTYDLTPARELFGYEPRDCFPEGIEEWL